MSAPDSVACARETIATVMRNEIDVLAVPPASRPADVVVNFHFTADEAGYILADSEAVAVFSGEHRDLTNRRSPVDETMRPARGPMTTIDARRRRLP